MEIERKFNLTKEEYNDLIKEFNVEPTTYANEYYTHGKSALRFNNVSGIYNFKIQKSNKVREEYETDNLLELQLICRNKRNFRKCYNAMQQGIPEITINTTRYYKEEKGVAITLDKFNGLYEIEYEIIDPEARFEIPTWLLGKEDNRPKHVKLTAKQFVDDAFDDVFRINRVYPNYIPELWNKEANLELRRLVELLETLGYEEYAYTTLLDKTVFIVRGKDVSFIINDLSVDSLKRLQHKIVNGWVEC